MKRKSTPDVEWLAAVTRALEKKLKPDDITAVIEEVLAQLEERKRSTPHQ